MNKRILIAIVVLAVVIVGAIGAVALTRPGADTAALVPTPTATATPAPTPTPTPEEVVPPGVYVDYTPTAIEEAEGRRLLFFYAPWCPQCRELDEGILAMGVPDGVTIIKIDYDSNEALRQQYGVIVRTTFVELDEAGSVINSFVAYDTPQFQAVIDAML